ncbi:TetR/AcrR family transcriptional regulator [Nocardioides nematodiphilus]|uniref:TetR/AcrR family transcriptional regulator n=1 Tax=Nocardioides nematodiphilus TaxID=2849669 RepID=UPI001CD9C497|nr:TetR/AcrR family transcriptional regulator [Nocardioides nematodiphilus]MCA1983503.1 TetR/AcrR family transcriptional regulator [Nocardioides nematodiphilus]
MTSSATAAEGEDTTPAAAPRVRRTQAERRATTRGALLDATIDVLVDHGYAGLTTTIVCERAGVTRGAQAHYFATKADLVVQALAHLTEKLVDELVSKPLNIADDPVGQYEVLLNRLWEIFSGPVSQAQLELFVAARTDEDLHLQLVQFDATVIDTLRDAAVRVAPALAARSEFQSAMTTAIATIRGLRMLRAVASERTVRRAWPPARDQLLAGLPR